jgi:predicted GIY-YIG superfamily endonuclease
MAGLLGAESNGALSERCGQRVEGLTAVVTVFFVYILQCSDGTYYVGHTSELESRIKQHNEARGSNYTKCRLPVALVYSEVRATLEAAVARERQIKGWTREKKSALIEQDFAALKTLSARRRYR